MWCISSVALPFSLLGTSIERWEFTVRGVKYIVQLAGTKRTSAKDLNLTLGAQLHTIDNPNISSKAFSDIIYIRNRLRILGLKPNEFVGIQGSDGWKEWT